MFTWNSNNNLLTFVFLRYKLVGKTFHDQSRAHYTAEVLKTGEWLHYDGKMKSPHTRPVIDHSEGNLQHALYVLNQIEE